LTWRGERHPFLDNGMRPWLDPGTPSVSRKRKKKTWTAAEEEEEKKEKPAPELAFRGKGTWSSGRRGDSMTVHNTERENSDGGFQKFSEKRRVIKSKSTGEGEGEICPR